MAYQLVTLTGGIQQIVNVSGGLVPRGAFDVLVTYAIGDMVDYNGSSYVLFTTAVAGTLPTDGTKWGLVAEKGDPLTVNAGENIDIDVISPTEITVNTVEDDDTALTANSATKIPSQKAVKAYADTKLAKATNVTSINDTGIANGEIAVFNLTNKDIRTSDKTIVTTIGSDDTTVPTSKAVKDATVASNVAITGATKTKITYDAKGLVTAGADAGTSDITGLDTALAGKVAKAGDTMGGNLNMGTNKLIGGTGITDILKLQGTTGNGTSTSPAIQLLTGNNGGTTALTVLNNGNVGVGTATPVSPLQVNASNNTYLSEMWLNSGTANSGPYLRVGTSASYPHYIGSQFGTNQAWSGLGLIMRDNANQFVSHGGSIRFSTSSQATKKDVAYTSKTDATKAFSFTADADIWGCYPGSTFTIGSNTYTVKSAANDRIVVLEDISGEAATGTLTGVSYTPIRMNISTTGAVGVNNTTLTSRFSVATASATDVGQIIQGYTAQTGDLLRFYNSAGSTLSVFNSAGSLGIGTTTPNVRLEVVGPVADFPVTSGTTQTAGALRIKAASGSNGILDIGGNGAFGSWLQSTNASNLALTYPLLFNPNGGNVGIGTTAPGAQLQVTSSAAATIGQIIKGAASQTANLFEIQNSAAAKLFQISAAGAITTTAYERHIQLPAKVDGTTGNQPTTVDFGTVGGLQFATTGAKYAYAQFEVPDDWDGTDMYFEVDWFPDSGAISGTDAVEWVINYRCIAEGESILNGTVKTLSIIDTNDYAQYVTKHARFTLPFNDANQPITKQDHVYIQITRNTATANDFGGSVTTPGYEVIYNSIGLPTSN